MVSQLRIFIFKSEAKPDPPAFGGDLAGSQLPSQFKPWRAVGAVAVSGGLSPQQKGHLFPQYTATYLLRYFPPNTELMACL